MDMERGEGTTLARTWRIRAYPTLLFFNADGVEVHRHMGYIKAEDTIQLGITATGKK